MTLPSTPSPADLAGHLAERFDEDQLPYAFGGALGLGAWGVPRMTSDVDVSVFVREDGLDGLFDAVERAGAIVDRAAARRDVARTGMFVALLAGTRIDLFIAHHPLHGEMERRRVALTTPSGQTRWFLSAEDVALTKLIYGRPKDVSDLDRLFAVQAGKLDVGYIRGWLARIVPSGDPRHSVLEDLTRRFGAG